jgi:SAM-dependent methyltransferase
MGDAGRAHRDALIDFWQIGQGSAVLEIGCGQGDTTASLAVRVGANGFVHAVDCAAPDYGAPETLGQARERLLKSDVGGRIKMDFQTDVLSPEFLPTRDCYDYAVLSHCAWYLKSVRELEQILAKVRGFARVLCVAEWDLRMTDPRQQWHYRACQLQSVCNAFAPNAQSNVQTLLHRRELISAATRSGWTVANETRLQAPQLQDAVWERGNALEVCPAQLSAMNVPEKLRAQLLAELDELRDARAEEMLPLPVLAFTALRQGA